VIAYRPIQSRNDIDHASEELRETMQIGRERRWLWAVAAVAVTGTAVFVASRGSDQAHAAFAREAPVSPAAFKRTCPPGAPTPTRYFDLGRSFAGLRLTSHSEICNPASPPGATVASGPSEAVGYVSVVYGSCTPASGEGCVPPLNVQSWPECARDPKTYKPPGRLGASAARLNPSEAVTVSAAPWIPARSFEAGTRLELYTGETTIVVFAGESRLAAEAGAALATAAATHARPASAPRLRSAAHQPGDASTCRHRLPSHHSTEEK
jgi:hypothetical protein